MSEWRNRIVGHGEEDPTQLLANPKNWRTHPARQREALRGALDQVGWVQQVLVNRTTGHVVDGHARIEEAITRNEPTVPVLYVELEPHEEEVVLATLDPIGALATRNDEALRQLLAEVEFDSAALRDMTDELAAGLGDAPGNGESIYTADSHIPQYQIVGERPAPAELHDETKTRALREAIEAVGLEEETRDFLLSAASRHTVFDYRKIAEFYPHASPEVQRLMEDSALVIIDTGDAIRNGFMRVSARLEELRGG